MSVSIFYKKLIIGTDHDSFYGFPSPHKILGYSSLVHVAYRYMRFIMGLQMFSNHWTDLACIGGHLILSCSSFLFPIRIQRNYQNQIIWRELQLHNIVFASRSCTIFTYSYFFPENAHFINRFLIVMSFHALADLVTRNFGQGTTMRDMSWDKRLIPISYKIYFDRFYALSQFGATTFLIFADSFHLENALMILFAIQISTFLMTLRLKGLIDNDIWHVSYSLALLMNFHVGLFINNGRFCLVLYLLFYFLRISCKQFLVKWVPIMDNKYLCWLFILCLGSYYYPIVLQSYPIFLRD